MTIGYKSKEEERGDTHNSWAVTISETELQRLLSARKLNPTGRNGIVTDERGDTLWVLRVED